jgi:hypothetical protein
VQGCGRCDVDHAPPRGVDHAADEGAAGEIWTDEINHDRLDPALGVRVGEQGDRPEDARRINEYLRPPQLGLDLRLEPLDIVATGDVAPESVGAAGDACNACAGVLEGVCDCASDAAARAHDDRDGPINRAHRGRAPRWNTSRTPVAADAAVSSTAGGAFMSVRSSLLAHARRITTSFRSTRPC